MGFYVDDRDIINAVKQFGYGVGIEITSSISSPAKHSGKNRQLQNSKRCLEDLTMGPSIDSCLVFVKKRQNTSNCDISLKIEDYNPRILSDAQYGFREDPTIYPHHKQFLELLEQSVSTLNNKLNNVSRSVKLQIEDALLYKKPISNNYSMVDFMILPQNEIGAKDTLHQVDNSLLEEIYLLNPEYFKELVGIKIEDLQDNKSDKNVITELTNAYSIFCEGFDEHSLVSGDQVNAKNYRFSLAKNMLVSKFYMSLLGEVKSELLEHYVQSILTDNLKNLDYRYSRHPVFRKKSGRIISSPDLVLAVDKETFYYSLEKSKLVTFSNFDRTRKEKEKPNPSSYNHSRRVYNKCSN